MKILDIFVPQVQENYIMRISEDMVLGLIIRAVKTHYQIEGEKVSEIILYHPSTGRFIGENEVCRVGESGIESGDRAIFLWK